MGFRAAKTGDGGNNFILRSFVVKDAEVLLIGEMLKLDVSTGKVEGATTGSTTLAGVSAESVDNTDDGLSIKVYLNPNIEYEVDDANARVAGAKLDIATGGLGVTTDSNHDLVVVKDSTATEPTTVALNGTHYLSY